MERLNAKNLPSELQDYIDHVEHGEYKSCIWQHKLCNLIKKIIAEEELYIDREQLEKYLSYQKYFPYALFPWEVFIFTLHNCVYDADGDLRFPAIAAIVGRGAGKNGYMSFEDFCLLSSANGIKNYHIDTFANSEEQASTSFKEVYSVLEDNKAKLSKHFKWNLEKITNTDTGSEYRYKTSNAGTKDGGRPGKVNFDEIHAYENYDLITVGRTGLGKVRHPRETIISTNGKVRGGPFDDILNTGKDVLNGDYADNGTIYFICQLGSAEEVDDESNWYMANPSLQYRSDLLKQMRKEYADYKRNPAANPAFMERRMNLPPEITENAVTSWENITACSRPIPYDLLKGRRCVAGIDYMQTTDFLGAGLLFRIDGVDYWHCHTWICSKSPDLPRIKAPLRKWESWGVVTYVDAAIIPPELPVIWLANEAKKLCARIVKVGIDKHRYSLLKNALIEWGDIPEEDVMLVRPSNEMALVPVMTDKFVRKNLVWGENNEPMQWMTNNSKTVISSAGNITYGKIEPKSRKTDTFKALVAAECASDPLDTEDANLNDDIFDVMTF